MTDAIPKRIIQTDKSADLPITLRAATKSIRLHSTDYDYMFFDDNDVEQFIDREFPQYRSVFDSFRVRIQRYDFFRYLAVYRYGGFYFDTDVLLAKPLDDLLEHQCVFPFEELSVQNFLRDRYDKDWEVGNYAFAAAAGHPFIKLVIDNCVRAQREPEWAEQMMASIPRLFRDEYFVFDTTGPGLVTRSLFEYATANTEVTILFPRDVCDVKSWHCFGDYAVHLQGGTWRSQKSFVYRRLYRLWEARQRNRMLADSLRRGPTRALEPHTCPKPPVST